MNHPLIPSREAGGGKPAPVAPRSQRVLLALRTRAILYGILAAAILSGLIALGSRGFHWFDATLIGYAVASIFAAAAVTYKYSFWLARPPTGRYWRRSWQLFFSYANFRQYTALIPSAIFDLFSQQFIRIKLTACYSPERAFPIRMHKTGIPVSSLEVWCGGCGVSSCRTQVR